MIRSLVILGPILWAIHRLKGTLMPALANLTNEVTEATTVMQSAATLIQGLKTQLDEAIAANNGGDNGAALTELSRQLDQHTNDLSRAIESNTPAAGGIGGTGNPGQTAPAAPEDADTFTPSGARIARR